LFRKYDAEFKADASTAGHRSAWRIPLTTGTVPPGGDAGMRIREIEIIGLIGATPEGGWSNELKPDDSVHTLVVVRTDEGVDGYGGAFTNAGLVRAAVAVLEPFWRGENPLEPERVSEKLHQHTFWLGRGGSLTHTISGIDIALSDFLGQATEYAA